MLPRLIWLALAGATGTLARFAVAEAVGRSTAGTFPWGTFLVNTLGCAIFGLVWALSDTRSLVPAEVRGVVLVGFLGAFTTFSTYAFEAEQMLSNGQWLRAGFHLVGQNVVGIAGVFLGIAMGRWF